MTMQAPPEGPLYRLDDSQVLAAKDVAAAGKGAADIFRQKAAEGSVLNEPAVSGFKAFVSPIEPNTRYLVHVGTVRRFPDPNSPTGFREYGRDGDVVAVFSSGICSSDNPLIIEWCEAHSGNPTLHRAYHQAKGDNARSCSVPIGLCRDSSLPGVNTWAELKEQQIATSRRNANVSGGVDLDAFLNAGLAQADQKLEDETGASRFQATANAARAAEARRSRGGNTEGATYLPTPWPAG